MQKTTVRFLKYSTVGVTTFGFDLYLLFFFVEQLLIPQVWAAGMAFLIAISINYFLSRRYVFKGTARPIKHGYMNFLIIALVGLIFVTGGMYLMTSVGNVQYVLARVIIAGVTGFWNYVINLYLNFRVAGKH